jgi:hypothetical protein
MPHYLRFDEEHWLRDKQDDGKIVILEDESVWEVHPMDRAAASRWLRISTITVAVKDTQKEEYRYVLTNTTEGETARANYLGGPSKTIASDVA